MNKENYINFSLTTHDLKCHLMGESTKETEYDDDPTPKVFTITTVDYQSYCDNILEITCVDDEHMHFVPLEEIFLLLRPLSDLTKEITHYSEKFVPIVKLAEKFFCKTSSPLTVYETGFAFGATYIGGLTVPIFMKSFGSNSFSVVQKLIEWKFDVSDLIKNKEAIDINTLKFNPYE